MQNKAVVAGPRFRTRDPIKEKTPGYLTGAFPKIFHHGECDPYGERAGDSPDLWDWAIYAMMSPDIRALYHPTFRYVLLNTVLRHKALARRGFAVQKQSKQEDLYTVEDLRKMSRNALIGKISAYQHDLPGSPASKQKMRSDLVAMIEQIQDESMDEALPAWARVALEGEQAATQAFFGGRVPCFFTTLTPALNQWDGLQRLLRECEEKAGAPVGQEFAMFEDLTTDERARQRAARNPGLTQWYVALRFELVLKMLLPRVGITD